MNVSRVGMGRMKILIEGQFADMSQFAERRAAFGETKTCVNLLQGEAIYHNHTSSL